MTDSLIFYYRDGCHLCEEMASLIHRGWPQLMDNMDWRNVDSQAEWKDLYGLKVPVLMLGDVELCHYTLDIEQMRKYFGDNLNPV